MNKTKLSVNNQIEHMKKIGISFDLVSEDDAKQFLTYNTYFFKIKSYAKNFEKYLIGNNSGCYIDLEFAYLVDLSNIDMALSRFILKLVLDIEHALRVKIVRDITNDDNEDGFSICDKFLCAFQLDGRLERNSKGSICESLHDKYKDNFPVWVLTEILTFGDLTKLYHYYYTQEKSNCSKEDKDIDTLLLPTKYLRNAAAHCNCMLNSIKTPYKNDKRIKACKKTVDVLAKGNVGRQGSRAKHLSNPIVNNFLSAFLLHNILVKSKGMKSHRYAELDELINQRMLRNKEFYSSNTFLKSTYSFVKESIECLKNVDNIQKKHYNTNIVQKL